MNDAQMESYMMFLNTQYTKAHEAHMSVIRRYKEDLLSIHDYRQLDTLYTTQLETLKPVIDAFLYFKNNQ